MPSQNVFSAFLKSNVPEKWSLRRYSCMANNLFFHPQSLLSLAWKWRPDQAPKVLGSPGILRGDTGRKPIHSELHMPPRSTAKSVIKAHRKYFNSKHQNWSVSWTFSSTNPICLVWIGCMCLWNHCQLGSFRIYKGSLQRIPKVQSQSPVIFPVLLIKHNRIHSLS